MAVNASKPWVLAVVELAISRANCPSPHPRPYSSPQQPFAIAPTPATPFSLLKSPQSPGIDIAA